MLAEDASAEQHHWVQQDDWEQKYGTIYTVGSGEGNKRSRNTNIGKSQYPNIGFQYGGSADTMQKVL
ncbi:hypothetical protein GDO78_002532 [Eleutherodactylus coqui]|uniref:Uncharacterized protein n=1 Tax=Eleutherodactylus coqui TaxID=57060 RepID=A0A8J6K6G8_ELECQ|nr:hypothetical protein GDO78_002532 [Eleutherodactylus coqui]